MLSRSAAPLGLLHVDWFDHDVDGQLRLVGEAAAAERDVLRSVMFPSET